MTYAGCLSPRERFHCAAIPSKIAPPACKEGKADNVNKIDNAEKNQHYFYSHQCSFFILEPYQDIPLQPLNTLYFCFMFVNVFSSRSFSSTDDKK